MIRRLLQGLEQHVPTLADALDLIDDEDLDRKVRRRGVDPRQEFAHVVDAVVRGRVHFADVERAALTDGDARRTFVAGFTVAQVRAVQSLGQDSGHRGLTGAARTHEQVGVGASA